MKRVKKPVKLSKNGKRIGRPPIVIPQEIRDQIRTLAGFGFPHDAIARLVKIPERTLERNCVEELRDGKEELKADLMDTLVQRAKAGDTACLIFANKTICGLRETSRTEHTGANGGPIETIDVAKAESMTLEELDARIERLRRS